MSSEHGVNPVSLVGQNPANPSYGFVVAWKKCMICPDSSTFKSPREFCRHLRDFHCSKEGGSFVCQYGMNNLCHTLPIEGVSDRDYEDHVARDHVAGGMNTGNKMSSRNGSQANSNDSSRSSTPVSVQSTEPSVVQDQHKWTVFMSRVNLPAVLNDPRLSRRETDFFTKTWGESFEKTDIATSPYVPNITKDHFRKYLKKTSTRYKDHIKLSTPPPQDDGKINHSEIAAEFPALQSRQLAEKSRQELESIPKIFMSQHFSLENPNTFNTVFPWTMIESSNQSKGGKTRQSSKLLQEKLSHYLDIVEVQIAKQISFRSEAFFQAMTSHDKLQERMSETCASIKELRDKMRKMESSIVEGPLKILKLQTTRANHVQVFNKLKLMSTVHQTQPTIQLLLSTNEFVGALDLISTTQEVLIQELAGVQCFRHLGSQLAELEKLIDKMMQEEFVKYATMDLNRPLTDGAAVYDEDYVLSEVQERLVSIIFGMLRQDKYNFIDIYREEAFTSIKALIKQTVIVAVTQAEDINTESNQGSLADQMRLLNYPQWMTLLGNVIENLLILLKRIKAVSAIMDEVVHTAGGKLERQDSIGNSSQQNGDLSDTSIECPPSPIRLSVSNDVDIMLTESEFTKVSASLKEMLCQVCDHAHDRCVKLLMARGKDGFLERLSSAEFVQLSRVVEMFVSDCENICGRKSTSLRASIQSQANKFVNRFHEERKTKLSLILDNERWKQADVPAEFQELVNSISQSGKLALVEKKNDSDGDKPPQEYLYVDGEKFAVVGTVLMLLKMVVEYCQCVNDISTVAPDILNRLIELFKMFNSRSCQLILGAGALQLVGLKTITTKNLALASRCLQLVVHYLPTVKQHFSDRLQGAQQNMLRHFEHVTKDYNDHIAELANKLIFIMESMFDLQLAKWEVKPPMPSNSFRNICRQMSKLHEAIVDLLPEKQVTELFVRIHASFKDHLRSQLLRLGVTNDGGPQHGLVTADVAFYTGNLKLLAGCSSLVDSMEDIWDKR